MQTQNRPKRIASTTKMTTFAAWRKHDYTPLHWANSHSDATPAAYAYANGPPTKRCVQWTTQHRKYCWKRHVRLTNILRADAPSSASPKPFRHSFPKESVGSSCAHSLRLYHHLRPACRFRRRPEGIPSSGPSLPFQSHSHSRSLPQGDRFRRQLDRLCRRPRHKTPPTGLGVIRNTTDYTLYIK